MVIFAPTPSAYFWKAMLCWKSAREALLLESIMSDIISCQSNQEQVIWSVMLRSMTWYWWGLFSQLQFEDNDIFNDYF